MNSRVELAEKRATRKPDDQDLAIALDCAYEALDAFMEKHQARLAKEEERRVEAEAIGEAMAIFRIEAEGALNEEEDMNISGLHLGDDDVDDTKNESNDNGVGTKVDGTDDDDEILDGDEDTYLESLDV